MTSSSTSPVTLGGLTRDELLHEALVLPRRARGPFSGLRVVSRPGWEQVITPSFRQGGLNEVSLAQLADDEADAVIAATLAEYDALGLRFRWTVGPDSRPLDLGDRLARRGFRGERVVVMAAEASSLRIERDLEVEARPVELAELELYARTVGAGWGVDPAPLLAYERELRDQPERRHFNFLAWHGAQPAGAANYYAFARSAYLMGGVVLPDHRRRGVYRSLLAARLRHARARGLDLVTTQARASSSAPILARLGFVSLCEIWSFSNR